MKKLMKLTALCLMLAMLGNLAACGNAQEKKSDNAIAYEGKSIELGQSLDDVKAALGEPDDYSEAKSCMFDGYDKMLTYDGMTLTTYPKEDKDFVYEIAITGDKASYRGLTAGSTFADVQKLYSDAENADVIFLTNDDNSTLEIFMADDQVVELDIFMEVQ